MSDEKAEHWQRIYEQGRPEELSWTESPPATSLALIEEASLPLDAAILDVGGGVSRLTAELLRRGHTDLTVADISARALGRARADLGEAAAEVTWVEADVRDHDFGRRFDIWHDRGVFHFMVDPDDRDAYLSVFNRTLSPEGHVIVATFGPDGPTECSGLPVRRYDADAISQTLGPDYELLSSQLHEHRTPSGKAQQFLYVHLRRQPK